MVNDILDLSGLEGENLTVHPEAFQISRLLVAVKSTAMGLIRNRQLDFNIETQIDIPEVLCGDRTRIKQVLFNLIANSVKFTETGQIKLSLRAKAEAGHCKVTFEVSDTGCGIAPELHDRVFNRFQQGHSSSNLRVSGTGLGLAVSRGLVRLMGGELEFESEVGKGSRFFFTLQLPIDSKTPDEKLNTEIDRLPIKKALKVLVVDDAESSRAFVSIMLEKRGHLLSEAARGENAIELSKESKFDLILMDIEMPGIGGKEAVRQIRADGGPSSNAYIVALTAQAFTSQKDEIIGSGCDAVLIKPFELEELDAILKKAMG
jgi:CheY-like chemotaxis protein